MNTTPPVELKSWQEFKVELWEGEDYIITGFGNRHPSTYTKRETSTIVEFLRTALPAIQRNALEAAAAVAKAEPELEGAMPDEVWDKMQTRIGAEIFLRATVRATKSNIGKKILSLIPQRKEGEK